MEILYSKDLKWYPCKCDNRNMRLNIIFDDRAITIGETEVIAVKNDERKKYVKCLQCGEFIPNTKKAIAEHAAKKINESSCFDCPYVRCDFLNDIHNKYKPLPDGTYERTNKSKVKFTCGINWRRTDISSNESRINCKYRNCTDNKENFVPIATFFGQYPDAFNDILTIDALNEKEWELDAKFRDTFIFKAKKRFTLHAEIDYNGIVKHFTYRNRKNWCNFMYSKKYNQIFWMIDGKYKTSSPYFLDNDRKEEINKVIEKLYNYEVKK